MAGGNNTVYDKCVNGIPQKDNLDNFAYTSVLFISSRWIPPNFHHLQLAVPLAYKNLFGFEQEHFWTELPTPLPHNCVKLNIQYVNKL